jgi:hypothetical protein
VLVHLISAPKRAFIMPQDLTGAKGTYCTDDRAAMSEADWERERVRRLRALNILTSDERSVIRNYWRLRDE